MELACGLGSQTVFPPTMVSHILLVRSLFRCFLPDALERLLVQQLVADRVSKDQNIKFRPSICTMKRVMYLCEPVRLSICVSKLRRLLKRIGGCQLSEEYATNSDLFPWGLLLSFWKMISLGPRNAVLEV